MRHHITKIKLITASIVSLKGFVLSFQRFIENVHLLFNGRNQFKIYGMHVAIHDYVSYFKLLKGPSRIVRTPQSSFRVL